MKATLNLNNLVIKAGAGAGKTTALVRRFAAFVKLYRKKNNGRFPKIVVTTFTKKATQELKERMSLAALRRNDEELFHFIGKKSHVQISTIHGVLSIFLSRYGKDIGLKPDFKIIDAVRNQKLSRKVLRQILLGDDEFNELLMDFGFFQLENALHRWMMSEIYFSGFSPVDKSYFQKKSDEVQQELAGRGLRLGSRFEDETLSDSFTKVMGVLKAIPPNGDPKQRDYLLGFSELVKGARANKATSASLMEEYKEWKKDLDNFDKNSESSDPLSWEKIDQINGLFSALAGKYRDKILEEKLNSGLISMSDLEYFSLLLVRQSPRSAAAFSQEWDYWMIDEYQDTSPFQVEILRALIGKQPQYIVGDPQQSIYLFRGARSEVFIDKMNEIGRVRSKMSNYRSRPVVLDFINELFGPDAAFESMKPKATKFKLTDEVAPVKLFEIDDEFSMQSACLVEIKKLLELGVRPEEICILVKSKKFFQELALEAKRQNVDLQIHGESGFERKREVLDLVQFLKFLANPIDNKNLVGLLRSPWFFLSDDLILKCGRARGRVFWKNFIDEATENSEIAQIVSKLKKYQESSASVGFGQTLKQMFIEEGVIDHSFEQDPTGRREANIWKLYSFLVDEEKKAGFNIFAFLEGLTQADLEVNAGEAGEPAPVIQPERINVMTVHKSKGLQFSYILLPDCGKSPILSKRDGKNRYFVDEQLGQWSLEILNQAEGKAAANFFSLAAVEEMKKRELEEFKRLLYVAVTRAKEQIILFTRPTAENNAWIHELRFLGTEKLEGVDAQGPQVSETSKMKPMALYEFKEKEKLVSMSVTGMVESDVGSANGQSAGQTPADSERLVSALGVANLGTEAHLLFENLKYMGFEGIRKMDLDAAAASAIDFLEKTNEVPMKTLLQEGFAEWGFVLKDNQKIIQGQVDLWGIANGQLWVVDYKTGSSKYYEKAHAQMRVYAWALKKMNQAAGINEVVLSAIFPIEKKVFNQKVSIKDL